VGGDGSVSRLVNELGEQARHFELAIVPAGTGNDLARSLGVPLNDPHAAWDIALHGRVIEIDVGVLHGGSPGHFVNGITAGFGSRQASTASADQKSYWGQLAYWLSAASQLGDMLNSR